MDIEKDLKKIKRWSEDHEGENWGFRKFLKSSDYSCRKIDLVVHQLYDEISTEIDCQTCGNCCRCVQLALTSKDIEEISRKLGLSIDEFKSRYVEEYGQKGEEFLMKTTPCPFLDDCSCRIYDFRPQACRAYPHLHKKDFVFRLISVISNCSVCPIVFNVYERLKDDLWQFDEFIDEI